MLFRSLEGRGGLVHRRADGSTYTLDRNLVIQDILHPHQHSAQNIQIRDEDLEQRRANWRNAEPLSSTAEVGPQVRWSELAADAAGTRWITRRHITRTAAEWRD